MSRGRHDQSGLTKNFWTDADFAEMGWHDATVHGLYVQESDDILPNLCLDLDYIVRWVHPVTPETHFGFWLSPATLVFDGVWDLVGDLDFGGMAPDLDIDDLHRREPEDRDDGCPVWHLEGHSFELRFRASGFRQYFREVPRLMQRRSLKPLERGGCSFAETAFG